MRDKTVQECVQVRLDFKCSVKFQRAESDVTTGTRPVATCFLAGKEQLQAISSWYANLLVSYLL